jgi:hypothetical protein
VARKVESRELGDDASSVGDTVAIEAPVTLFEGEKPLIEGMELGITYFVKVEVL